MKGDINVTVADFYDEVLGYASLAELSIEESKDIMAESLRLLPPPLITYVLDSSGSMACNAPSAKVAAMALVDVLPSGSFLRVILFDTRCVEVVPPTEICFDSRDIIKSKIRDIVCLGGGTNIELPLVEMLSSGPTCICFVSDGMANVGFNITSDSLLKIARKCPSYSESVINTLGIQFDNSVALNAKLLKDLAEDTGGIFTIAPDSETLKTFVGQILGTYYFQRGKVNISLRSAYGSEATCEPPLNGWKLRADKPTKILFTWKEQPQGFKTCITHVLEPGQCEVTTVRTALESQKADAEQEFRIVAAIVAKYLEGGAPKDICEAVERLSRGNAKLIPLVVALRRYPAPVDSPDYVQVSQQAYEFSSMGGGDMSPALITLGNQTQHLSQQQHLK